MMRTRCRPCCSSRSSTPGGRAAVAPGARHRRDRRRGPRAPGGPLLPRLLRPLLLPAALHHLRRPPALRPTEAGQRGSRRRRDRAAGPHRRTAPGAVAGTGDPASGRCLLCPRGDPGLVRGQRRGLRHRPGPELAARRDDRLGAGRRPGGGEAAGPPSPPVQGAPHSQARPASCRVVAKAEHRARLNPRFVTSLPDTFSARTVYERVYARGATWRTRSAAISSPTGPRRRASPPTSSGSSSPPSPRSSSLRSGVRCTAPAWPAPPPERCGSSS